MSWPTTRRHVDATLVSSPGRRTARRSSTSRPNPSTHLIGRAASGRGSAFSSLDLRSWAISDFRCSLSHEASVLATDDFHFFTNRFGEPCRHGFTLIRLAPDTGPQAWTVSVASTQCFRLSATYSLHPGRAESDAPLEELLAQLGEERSVHAIPAAVVAAQAARASTCTSYTSLNCRWPGSAA